LTPGEPVVVDPRDYPGLPTRARGAAVVQLDARTASAIAVHCVEAPSLHPTDRPDCVAETTLYSTPTLGWPTTSLITSVYPDPIASVCPDLNWVATSPIIMS
jgi:hypothetical protein